MMNRATDTSIRKGGAAALLTLGVLPLVIGTVGCDDKSGGRGGSLGGSGSTETAQADRPADPPPSVAQADPEPRTDRGDSFGDPLQGLDLEETVEFPPINAPSSKAIAEAVAALAGAIARGDSQELHPMLDQPNQAILDELVETGAWEDATSGITRIRVCTLEETDSTTIRVGLGVESLDGAYLLGWEGRRLGSGWLFSGIALDAPASASNAAQLDGASLAARAIPEPGEIIDDTFDPTITDPRRDDNTRRRRGRGGGGGRRGLR